VLTNGGKARASPRVQPTAALAPRAARLPLMRNRWAASALSEN